VVAGPRGAEGESVLDDFSTLHRIDVRLAQGYSRFAR